MKTIFLFLCLFPLIAEAKFIISGGPEITGSFESDIEARDGDPSVKAFPLPGFRVEGEYGHARFPDVTAFTSVIYNQGPGRVQYDFTDSDQSVTEIDDVMSNVSLTRLLVGARYKFIDQKNIFFFAGGGFQFGVLNLNLDRDNFKGKALPTDDFEQNEHQNFWGYFGELSGEMKFNNNFGLRLSAQVSKASTDTFEILGDREVDFTLMTLGLSYIWYL